MSLLERIVSEVRFVGKIISEAFRDYIDINGRREELVMALDSDYSGNCSPYCL